MIQLCLCMARRVATRPSCLLSSVSVFYQPGDWLTGLLSYSAADVGVNDLITTTPRVRRTLASGPQIQTQPSFAQFSLLFRQGWLPTPIRASNQFELSQGRPADQLGVNNSGAPVLAAVAVAERSYQTNLINGFLIHTSSCLVAQSL